MVSLLDLLLLAFWQFMISLFFSQGKLGRYGKDGYCSNCVTEIEQGCDWKKWGGISLRRLFLYDFEKVDTSFCIFNYRYSIFPKFIVCHWLIVDPPHFTLLLFFSPLFSCRDVIRLNRMNFYSYDSSDYRLLASPSQHMAFSTLALGKPPMHHHPSFVSLFVASLLSLPLHVRICMYVLRGPFWPFSSYTTILTNLAFIFLFFPLYNTHIWPPGDLFCSLP